MYVTGNRCLYYGEAARICAKFPTSTASGGSSAPDRKHIILLSSEVILQTQVINIPVFCFVHLFLFMYVLFCFVHLFLFMYVSGPC
jgi:hypothetical protein